MSSKNKKPPKFIKRVLIVADILENNVEPHIFRYKTLYDIYYSLYLLTYSKPLSNLNYFKEDDGFLIAEIKGTEMMYLKDRLKAHIDLLRKIKNGSDDLEYSQEPLVDNSDSEQTSLFF